MFAQEFLLPTDNFQQRLQIGVASGRSGFSPANPAPIDVVVGYIKVDGEPVEGGDFDVMSLRDRLPPVPPFLRPVDDEELRVRAARGGAPKGAGRQLPDARHELLGLRADGLSAVEVPRRLRGSTRS